MHHLLIIPDNRILFKWKNSLNYWPVPDLSSFIWLGVEYDVYVHWTSTVLYSFIIWFSKLMDNVDYVYNSLLTLTNTKLSPVLLYIYI